MVSAVHTKGLVNNVQQRDVLPGLAVVSVCALATRDAFAGTIRWLLSISNLTLLWYAVDVVVLVSSLLFLRTAVRARSALPWLFVAVLAIGLFTASYFLSTKAVFLVSATKMFLPLLLGWSFAGIDLPERYPRAVRYLVFVSLLATFGVCISPYVDFPWAQFTVETFGVERKGGEIRQIIDQTRYAGFAGQNALAAMSAFLPILLIHKRIKPNTLAVLLGLCLIVSLVTTSRTAQVAVILFAAWLFAGRYFVPSLRSISSYRIAVAVSLVFALMPIFLVSFASTVDLTSINRGLASFQERIQLSWQYPFSYWYDVRPEALVIGCGAGCFTSPMMYTDKFYAFRAIDNFYIETIVMFGMFSVFQVGIMVASPLREVDKTKLLGFAVFNVIASLTDGYTTAILCFVAGYSTSGAFKTSNAMVRPGHNGSLLTKRARTAHVNASQKALT